MIACSSIYRLRHFLELELNSSKAFEQARILTPLLYSISRNIESYLGKTFLLQERVEYFDTLATQKVYFPKYTPISAISNVYSDSLGLYDGGESLETDTIVGIHNRSIILSREVTAAKKGLKLVYTAGSALHGTRTVFTVSNVTGTTSAGKYIKTSSGALGILVSVVGTVFTVETLYGIFFVGDTLSSHTTENGSADVGVGATVATITSQSLVEQFPEIGIACDMQVRYMYKHKDNFEDSSVNRDSSSFGSGQFVSVVNSNLGAFNLRPEVLAVLSPLRYYSV
jgi:hypothetical protein